MDKTNPAPPRKKGRPRKGVVRVNITLPPEVRDWLASQPDGMSGTITRMVDQLMRYNLPRR